MFVSIYMIRNQAWSNDPIKHHHVKKNWDPAGRGAGGGGAERKLWVYQCRLDLAQAKEKAFLINDPRLLSTHTHTHYLSTSVLIRASSATLKTTKPKREGN